MVGVDEPRILFGDKWKLFEKDSKHKSHRLTSYDKL